MYENEVGGASGLFGPVDYPVRQTQTRALTIKQEIEGNIAYLTEQLDKKQRLLKLLKENPAIEEFMNLSR